MTAKARDQTPAFPPQLRAPTQRLPKRRTHPPGPRSGVSESGPGVGRSSQRPARSLCGRPARQ